MSITYLPIKSQTPNDAKDAGFDMQIFFTAFLIKKIVHPKIDKL